MLDGVWRGKGTRQGMKRWSASRPHCYPKREKDEGSTTNQWTIWTATTSQGHWTGRRRGRGRPTSTPEKTPTRRSDLVPLQPSMSLTPLQLPNAMELSVCGGSSRVGELVLSTSRDQVSKCLVVNLSIINGGLALQILVSNRARDELLYLVHGLDLVLIQRLSSLVLQDLEQLLLLDLAAVLLVEHGEGSDDGRLGVGSWKCKRFMLAIFRLSYRSIALRRGWGRWWSWAVRGLPWSWRRSGSQKRSVPSRHRDLSSRSEGRRE